LRQAQAELDAISNRLAQNYPDDDKGWGAIRDPRCATIWWATCGRYC